MALTGAPAVAHRPPGVRIFVRMKLRIIGNGLVLGSGSQTATFVMSCLFGAAFAILGTIAFISLSGAPTRTAAAVSGLIGAVIVVGWMLLPTLFFGVDETLDPARFALLPLTKARIAAGMGAAALVGIPPVATAVVLAASAVSAMIRAGVVAGAVALAGVVLTLLFCVAASRALTSALASALRSRRMRDVASVLVALLAASCGPLGAFASQMAAAAGGFTPLEHGMRVVGWTPLAAGFAAPYDVVAGHPLVAVGRLGVLVAGLGLTVWWWSATFEDAMVGVASGGRGRTKAVRGGAVAGLVPIWLRIGGVGPYRAIVARELRYWFRDNRRRIALLSAAVSGLTLPLIATIQGHGGFGLAFASSFSAWIAGVAMFQVFSMDGTAFSTHLLAGVPARIDVRARVTALALIILPVLFAFATASALLRGAAGQLPEAYGTMVATFGVAVGASTSFAIDGAFPMPEVRNPFAMRTGTGSAKSLLMFAVMGLTLVGTVPLYVLTFFVPRWTVLPIGIAWGTGAALIGSSIAAARLSRRGPELLLAVTPRR